MRASIDAKRAKMAAAFQEEKAQRNMDRCPLGHRGEARAAALEAIEARRKAREAACGPLTAQRSQAAARGWTPRAGVRRSRQCSSALQS